jgi:hypothetical protein
MRVGARARARRETARRARVDGESADPRDDDATTRRRARDATPRDDSSARDDRG